MRGTAVQGKMGLLMQKGLSGRDPPRGMSLDLFTPRVYDASLALTADLLHHSLNMMSNFVNVATRNYLGRQFQ